MSELGDRLRRAWLDVYVPESVSPSNDEAKGRRVSLGFNLAADIADEHEAVQLARSAEGKGPHAAAAARAFAQRLRESVPESVFTPDGRTVDAQSARLRRIDADLLDRWADEAER